MNGIITEGRAKFKVGDKVRASKFQTLFEKRYTPNWSTEVFEIVTVQRTYPVRYILRDSAGETISGGFYEYELHSVANPTVSLWSRRLFVTRETRCTLSGSDSIRHGTRG